MESCFPDDSALGQLFDEYIRAMHAGQVVKAKTLLPQIVEHNLADFDACKDNETVLAGEQAGWDTLKAFLALPNWQDVLAENIESNQDMIEELQEQSYQDWDQGNYYDSGADIGSVWATEYSVPSLSTV